MQLRLQPLQQFQRIRSRSGFKSAKSTASLPRSHCSSPAGSGAKVPMVSFADADSSSMMCSRADAAPLAAASAVPKAIKSCYINARSSTLVPFGENAVSKHVNASPMAIHSASYFKNSKSSTSVPRSHCSLLAAGGSAKAGYECIPNHLLPRAHCNQIHTTFWGCLPPFLMLPCLRFLGMMRCFLIDFPFLTALCWGRSDTPACADTPQQK